MSSPAFVVRRAAHAAVQDLGRTGVAHLGIAGNGASDQHSARTANILVGNADAAPLVEVTASEFVVTTQRPLLIAITGAARQVLVDGHRQPAWETLAVDSGATVTIAVPEVGIRSYLAVNGAIEADSAFGSVAPDALFGIGRWLRADDEVRIDTRYAAPAEADSFAGVFRLGAQAVTLQASPTIDVTAGPDLPRLSDDAAWLQTEYTVSPQSDAVGLRLDGPSIGQRTTAEILSRGVPVGAVEVPPSSGLLVLLRARLLTAGYPVIAVVTTDALDRLGQVGPGTVLRFALSPAASVRARLLAHETQRSRLAERVGRAMVASGFGAAVDPAHRSRSN